MAKTKIYKSDRSLIHTTDYHEPSRQATVMRMISDYKENALLRIGNFTNEIIWDKMSFVYPKTMKGSEFRKGLFLFGMVRKDVKAYIRKKNGKIRLPKQYPVNVINYNYKYTDEGIAGTDIDHAYWRIAYLSGIISENTYLAGLKKGLKQVSLAALSTLGRGKDYQVIKAGVLTDDVVKIGGDEAMQRVYKYIRYSCYKMMQECAVLLGRDFVAYRTDAIYYKNTEKNKKMITEYFSNKDFKFKQLRKRKSISHKEDGLPLE